MGSTEVFSTAAVTAPHQAAADAGRNVLAMGGNAVEAMVAMAATIAVVYPHMNSIGGDCFWLLHEPKGRVRAFEACGPEVFTLRELVRQAGQWAGVNRGKGRPVFNLPMWMGWFQAMAMEMAPGEPLMSRDNLASMKVDNIASGQLPGFQALGIAPSPVAGVAPAYLGHRGPRSRLNAWRAHAGR